MTGPMVAQYKDVHDGIFASAPLQRFTLRPYEQTTRSGNRIGLDHGDADKA